MSKADKKQRHKAKREAKRKAHRRREAVSPIKRLADAPGELECWMSDDFEGFGQAQLFAWKKGGGMSGLAAFLIDEGVVGLKDAWTRMQIEHAEVEEMLESVKQSGFTLRRVEPEVVRRWVAAAARWAHENGMVLPKDWLKTASLIGGVGNWESADVSAFKKEFAGHPRDLRQRLIGEPFETYIQRPEIQFIFSEEATYMDQGTGDYIDPANPFDLDEKEIEEAMESIPDEELDEIAKEFDAISSALAQETTRWWKDKSEMPSPELQEAWRSIVMATLMGRAVMPDGDKEEVNEVTEELLDSLGARLEASRREEYDRALNQALDHLRAAPDTVRQAVNKFRSDAGDDRNIP